MSEDEESIEIGIDVDKDKKSDFFVILKGKRKVMAVVLAAFCAGLLSAKILALLGI